MGLGDRLARLLVCANRDRRDELRRVMVALFVDFGQEHPLAVQYRRRLATALY